MEPKAKSNPVISFLKRIFDKISSSSLFSILTPNASSTIGDQYLVNSDDYDNYKRQSAEEAGLTAPEYTSIDEAFNTAMKNITALKQDTFDDKSKNSQTSGLEPLSQDQLIPEQLKDKTQDEPELKDGSKEKTNPKDNELQI